jgi:hypothetical protein
MEESINVDAAVMTGRMWIEFGKMFNAISSEGYEIVIESFIKEPYVSAFVATVFGDGALMGESDEYLNPYAALKELYFTGYLGIKEWEDITLDFENEELQILCEVADKEGITIDEFMMNAIQELINSTPQKEKEEPKEEYTPIEVAECCYTCDFIREDYNITGAGCVKLDRETEYQKICKHYFPKTLRGL